MSLQLARRLAPLTLEDGGAGVRLPDGRAVAGPLLVNYGRFAFPTCSFGTALDADEAFFEGLRGRVVLLGASNPEAHDAYPTPTEARSPGVAILAAAAHTLASGRTLEPANPGWDWLQVGLALAGAMAATVRLAWGPGLLACAGLGAAVLAGSAWAFCEAGVTVRTAPALLAVPAGFLSAYVVRFLAESRSRGVLRGLLASNGGRARGPRDRAEGPRPRPAPAA